METSIRATGPLGSLSIPGAPARKTRRKKAQVASGELGATGVSSTGLLTRDEAASSYSYTRAASAETLSDVALVEQTLEGKQEAFAVLVERYKDAVQNLAYRMLSNVTEAEDVTQEVFVRAYTQLATYKPAH